MLQISFPVEPLPLALLSLVLLHFPLQGAHLYNITVVVRR